jgi:hypothetical protein
LAWFAPAHRRHFTPHSGIWAWIFGELGYEATMLTTISRDGEAGGIDDQSAQLQLLPGTRAAVADAEFWRINAAKFEALHADALPAAGDWPCLCRDNPT